MTKVIKQIDLQNKLKRKKGSDVSLPGFANFRAIIKAYPVPHDWTALTQRYTSVALSDHSSSQSSSGTEDLHHAEMVKNDQRSERGRFWGDFLNGCHEGTSDFVLFCKSRMARDLERELKVSTLTEISARQLIQLANECHDIRSPSRTKPPTIQNPKPEPHLATLRDVLEPKDEPDDRNMTHQKTEKNRRARHAKYWEVIDHKCPRFVSNVAHNIMMGELEPVPDPIEYGCLLRSAGGSRRWIPDNTGKDAILLRTMLMNIFTSLTIGLCDLELQAEQYQVPRKRVNKL